MLDKLYASALKFMAPQTLPETYATAVNEALKLAQADYGTIFLNQEGNLHRVYTNVPLIRRAHPRKDGYTQKAFKTGKTFVLTPKEFSVHPTLIKNHVKSLVIIPLTHHKKSLGVLTLQAKENKHFTKARIETLRLFGSLVSLAIEKNQLYSETKNALKIRDLFISMAAHELRTPTTTIQGYAQLMKGKLDKKQPVPIKWVETLQAETRRLNNLLQELLQINQIKTGHFIYQIKENSIRQIVERAIAASKITHPNHKIKLEDRLNGRSDIILSDFDKILQAIINLINNAAKFSPPDAPITIRLSAEETYISISVRDRGKGIAKRDLPYIFDGFYKGRDNTKEGMGLGLYISESIIQRHRGIISLNSKVGKGTIAEIKLPAYEGN